ncbi:hypothetical protein O181_011841 [Austropuccinia psidii MF-1]|uniref:Uncharacterized protein n=1 Tax=Austropuccinia psidii MF-1 TaxID=1389203 RepID=A0A9Q3BTH9_9BASI|nr:hypothetical protein [Austropuccinia psidii MF-1]
MSHTYTPTPHTAQAPAHAQATAQAPTPAHAIAQAPAPTPATRGSTCVTCKWSMPLDIRPSQALPLCACVTPIHPLHRAVGSNNVTPSF